MRDGRKGIAQKEQGNDLEFAIKINRGKLDSRKAGFEEFFRTLRTRSEIHRIAKSVCGMYTERLKELFVLWRGEWLNDANNVGFVIDCTVVQIKRPGVGLDEAKLWFSGKHHIYCVMKEVVVNSRTGTAAFVSTGRPGSVHDVTVMRTDSAAINRLVGRATLLGDKGYRGGESSVPTSSSSRTTRAESSASSGRWLKASSADSRSTRRLGGSGFSPSTRLMRSSTVPAR